MIKARTRTTAVFSGRWLAAAAVLTVALGAVTPEHSHAQDRKIRWKMASSFAASLPILGTSGVYFTKRLQQATNGRMRIKFFDPGKLVPGLEVFEAVSTGGVQAGFTAAGFWIGKIPAAAFFGAVPFGPDTNEYLAWIFNGGGLQLWRELYAKHNLIPFPCGILAPEASGWFRVPIESVEQLKGLKMRFYGLGGKAMQKLGMSIQLLAPGDIFTALDRGVLDATEFSMPAIDEKLGFYQIAKHYYFPGWHQQASILELLINKKSWDDLTVTDQTLIEMACRDTIVKSITEGETLQGPAINRMKAKGVKIHKWSPEMLAKFQQAYQEVIQDETQQDAEFARVWDSLSKFRQNYAEWRGLSRLPQ